MVDLGLKAEDGGLEGVVFWEGDFNLESAALGEG